MSKCAGNVSNLKMLNYCQNSYLLSIPAIRKYALSTSLLDKIYIIEMFLFTVISAGYQLLIIIDTAQIAHMTSALAAAKISEMQPSLFRMTGVSSSWEELIAEKPRQRN